MPIKNEQRRKSSAERTIDNKESGELAVKNLTKSKPVEIYIPDTMTTTEDKQEEEILSDEESEGLVDDSGLDEELDPFGDKWER